jgi:hypothetical protein
MTTKQALRWLAVLPGAFLGGTLIMFPVHWLALYIHRWGIGEPIVSGPDGRSIIQSIPVDALAALGNALFVPGAVVLAGAYIAPKHRFRTGVTIVAIQLTGVCYVFKLIHERVYVFDGTAFQMVLTVLLWVVSFGLSLYFLHETDRRRHD